MPTYDEPLPQGTEQQYGWQHEIHQFVGDKDDAAADHDESNGDQRGVDPDGTAQLIALHTQQQGDEDHAQQPCIFHQ